MEIETESKCYSIRIPLSMSDEYIELFVDELEDDPGQLIESLFDECVPPKYWIQIAIGYYSQKKYTQFLTIVDTILKKENYEKFEDEFENKLVLMNYRLAYKLKTSSVTPEEYKIYDIETDKLTNREGQDKSAASACLALKCIWCLRTEDMKAALTLMLHALNRDHTCLLASIAAALYYIQSHDYKKAIDSYKIAITYHPDCPVSIRIGVAYCFFQLGNYKRAFMALDRALQLDPLNEEALAMKASLLRTSPDLSPQDRITASMQVVKSLYQVNPSNPQALCYIADHYFWRWITVDGVKASVEKGSDSVTVSADCGDMIRPAMVIRINGISCRVQSTRNAVTNNHIQLLDHYIGETVVDCDVMIRDTQSSLEYSLKAAKAATVSAVRSEALELAGRCYHCNNQWMKAKEMFDKSVHANKRNILAQYGLAQVCIHMSTVGSGKKEKDDLRNQARTCVAACSQYGVSSHEVTFLTAYIHFKSSDWQKALMESASLPDKQELISIRTFLNVLLLKAQLLQGSFQNEEDIIRARVLYESFIALSVENRISFTPLVWNNIAVLRLEMGSHAEALTALEEVLKYACQTGGVDLDGRSLGQLTEEEAGHFLAESTNVTLSFNYGVLLDMLGRTEMAHDVWEMILKQVPQYYECELRLARQEIRTERLEDGEERLRRICDMLEAQLKAGFLKDSTTLLIYVTNSYTDSLSMLTSILARQGREEEAINLIIQSFLSKMQSHDLYINTQLAGLYLHAASHGSDHHNYFRRGVEMLQRALERNPRNVYLANACGVILQRTGKPQSAMHMFKRVREAALTFDSCCINVAHMYMIQARYHDAACLYETALRRGTNWKDVDLQIFLALALMNANNHTEALTVLQKAVMICPTDDRLQFNLAVCNINYAQTIVDNVAYYHNGIFDPATQQYMCCRGVRDAKGCQTRSLRSPGEMIQVEVSVQFAINAYMGLQRRGSTVVEQAKLEAQLVRCKILWEQRDQQKALDQQQAEALERAALNNRDVTRLLEQKRLQELQTEYEKRERMQRILQATQEEKQRLAASMQIIESLETVRPESHKERASAKTHGTKTSRGSRNVAAHKRNDKVIESSDSDTDDHGEESEDEMADGDTQGIFVDDEDDAPVTKKRAKKVLSSDSEEEVVKRPRVEKETEEGNEGNTDDAIDAEVNDMFDEEE